MISLTPCVSSALTAYGYDAAKQMLYLQFPSGNVYSYAEVSTDLFAALQAAESVGRFYGANIKGKYEAKPVLAEPARADSEGGEPD